MATKLKVRKIIDTTLQMNQPQESMEYFED